MSNNRKLVYLSCRGMVVLYIFMAVFIMEGLMANENVETYEFEDINSCDVIAVISSVAIKTHNLSKTIVIFENNMDNPELVSIAINEKEGKLSVHESLHDNEARGETSIQIFLPQNHAYHSLDCISAKGFITFQGINTETIKTHAAMKEIEFKAVRAKELRASTALTSIILRECEIEEVGNLVTSSGTISIDIPYLPATELSLASSSGEVNLRVPTFGKSFELILSRNEDQGKIYSPFECVESTVSRLDDNDTYRTHKCVIQEGSGGPKVDLLTASGTIRILSESMYTNQKEVSIK